MEYLRAALRYFTFEFLNFWFAKVWYLQRETGAAVGVQTHCRFRGAAAWDHAPESMVGDTVC